jgi:hypothetical protein
VAGEATYELRFFFEWGGGCLWPGNDTARRDFDLGPYDLLEPSPLPLSPAILGRCRTLAEWHDTSLNWDYPPDPGTWRQSECDRFNAAAAELLADIRRELGPAFRVADSRLVCVEDPELDTYLADPKGFRRK